jgi:hypothetical protein
MIEPFTGKKSYVVDLRIFMVYVTVYDVLILELK